MYFTKKKKKIELWSTLNPQWKMALEFRMIYWISCWLPPPTAATVKVIPLTSNKQYCAVTVDV